MTTRTFTSRRAGPARCAVGASVALGLAVSVGLQIAGGHLSPPSDAVALDRGLRDACGAFAL